MKAVRIVALAQHRDLRLETRRAVEIKNRDRVIGRDLLDDVDIRLKISLCRLSHLVDVRLLSDPVKRRHDEEPRIRIFFKKIEIQEMKRPIEGVVGPVVHRAERRVPMSVIVRSAENDNNVCVIFHVRDAAPEVLVPLRVRRYRLLARNARAADAVAARDDAVPLRKKVPVDLADVRCAAAFGDAVTEEIDFQILKIHNRFLL